MSNLALRVDNLGKKYRIGAIQEPYATLRDTITRSLAAPFRRMSDLLRGQVDAAADFQSEIWALRDVSFEVKHGEVLGIIGRNGAGKSTLLKILSRITEPSSGYADVYGRVGALLEVGTGFHPELSGRENVYLNGAILGMSRRDIQRKFDAIVAFAGVEKFIDAPVKHYSSGMGLRLGFAVAAHLEPDILVVDEVLAVGDAEFQKKCLGRMSDVASEGRTVLFVSHNMGAVQNLCQRGIVLQEGHVMFDGAVGDALQTYLDDGKEHSLYAHLDNAQRTGGEKACFKEVRISSSNASEAALRMGDDIIIETQIESRANLNGVAICIVIWSAMGVRIIDANTSMQYLNVNIDAQQVYTATFCLKHVLLRPATYYLELYMGIEHQALIDYIPVALRFDIEPNLDMAQGYVDYPGFYRCAFDVHVSQQT